MVGDQDDMVARLKGVLPPQWFPDVTPVLDSLLAGLGSVWSWVYGLVTFAGQQTRVATASGVWLDMIANDLFGGGLSRWSGEADDAFRTRLLLEIRRRRGTRGAIISALSDLTGRVPLVFEPARIEDTGAWSGAGLPCFGFAYNAVGAWGDLGMPFQVFVTAFRPAGQGIADVGGWGGPAGYGSGPIEYGTPSMIEGPVTDPAIYAAVAAVMPATGIAWTHITN